MELSPTPSSIATPDGQPCFGTYAGELPAVKLGALSSAHLPSLPWRVLKHKRWQYTVMCSQEVVALFAISDLGYTATAFVTVVDLKGRRPLFDRGYLGMPGPLVKVNDHPGPGLAAHFLGLGARLSCRRGTDEGRYRVDVSAGLSPLPRHGVRWEAEVLAVGGAPPLAVIAPVRDGGVLNVTLKRAGLLGFGTLQGEGRRFDLDGSVAGMDYTHGLLARRTAWRWAMANGRLADGTPLGLNLVEGFNEGDDAVNENALWLGSRLIPLARARFDYNRSDVLDPWRVRTVDGSVDLRFRPLHAHREDRDFKLVKSHFAQPVGTFEGEIKVDGRAVKAAWLAGVTEDQDILW